MEFTPSDKPIPTDAKDDQDPATKNKISGRRALISSALLHTCCFRLFYAPRIAALLPSSRKRCVAMRRLNALSTSVDKMAC